MTPERRHNEHMSLEISVSLPKAGHSVELHEPSGKSSLGRVQSANSDSVVVALPSDAGIAASSGIGTEFRIVWPGGGGMLSLMALLAHRQHGPQLELWELTPTTAAEFAQRRLQPRIAVRGAITVRIASDPDALLSGHTTLTGRLVDLSESAVQCLLEVGADDVVVSSGSRCVCDFSLGDSRFSLQGSVLAAWTEDAMPSVRVVVRFDTDQSALVALARAVLDATAPTTQP